MGKRASLDASHLDRPLSEIVESQLRRLTTPSAEGYRPSVRVRLGGRGRFTVGGGHSEHAEATTTSISRAPTTEISISSGGRRSQSQTDVTLLLRSRQGGTDVRIAHVRKDWRDAPLEAGRPLVGQWLGSVAAACTALPGPSLTDKLLHPERYYITHRTLRGGRHEVAVDVAALDHDWPGGYWRDGYQRLRMSVAPDGHVAITGDKEARAGRWDRTPGNDLRSALRSALLKDVLGRLDPELVALTEQVFPSLQVYNLIQAEPRFRQLAQTAPLLARRLVEEARQGHLVRRQWGSRSDTRRTQSFARIPEMLGRPLKELTGACAARRTSWSIPEDEWEPASPAVVAYARKPIAELTNDPSTDGRTLLGFFMVQFLAAANVDRVRNLDNPRHWDLIRKAVSVNQVIGAAVFANPSAAERAIADYFPPHIHDLYERERVSPEKAVFDEIHDYLYQLRQEDASRELPVGIAELSFKRLCVASKAWHREIRLRDMEQELADLPGDEQAFAPTRLDGLVAGQFRLRQLRTPKALRSEGARMHHCVGSYAQRCLRGESVIFSVELLGADGSAEPIATMELTRSYAVRQLYGPHDAPVRINVRREIEAAIRKHKARKPYPSAADYLASKGQTGEGLAA